MSVVVWFTGLPSSGKSTLARKVRSALWEKRTPCCLLDSDVVRKALDPSPGFDLDGRRAFYVTLAGLAGLLARQGLAVLVAATANLYAYRELGRASAPNFVEVYVATSLEECKRRDAKGLYARAEAGEVSDVPGISAPYEPPANPDVVDDGQATSETVATIVARVQLFSANSKR